MLFALWALGCGGSQPRATPTTTHFRGELPLLDAPLAAWSVAIQDGTSPAVVELTDTGPPCTIHFGENGAEVRSEAAVVRLFVYPRDQEDALHRTEAPFAAISSHCPRDHALARTAGFFVAEDMCNRAFTADERCAARVGELEAKVRALGVR